MFSTKKTGVAILACAMAMTFTSNEVVEARHANNEENTKVTIIRGTSATVEDSSTQTKSLQERINAILNPPVEEEQIAELQEDNLVLSLADASAIKGAPMASRAQCLRYLLKNNPHPHINCSPEELVNYYYEEGIREGIRPDVAFAQALKETGFFRYGGTVVPAQNNYCGLGTTSATIRGAYFKNPKLGVRAHIQHLLAYTSTAKPKADVVDPRYTLVRDTYGARTLTDWEELNGRWAVPGNGYGQSILSMHKSILKS